MSDHWTERREGGGWYAIWFIRFIAIRCGRTFARALLYPTTMYFYLRRGPERRASREFLTRALGRKPTLLEGLRHIHAFAVTTLDRIYLLAESMSRFDIRVHGLDELNAAIDQQRGVLLFGAHMGSFQILQTLAERRPDLPIRILMDRKQTPALNELLLALNPKVSASVIDVGDGDTHVAIALQEAAQQGSLIGLLVDRSRPKEPTTMVPFFGENARFPIAPYLIASLLKIPVVLTFGIYRGGNRYDLYFETFADTIAIPRAERDVLLNQWAARFAARLEHYTRLDPFNWFNFYDFWHRPDDVVAVGGKPAVESVA